MPPKKTGKKKKGKGKGKGKKKGAKKTTTDSQPVINPDTLVPKVTLSVHLATPVADTLGTLSNPMCVR